MHYSCLNSDYYCVIFLISSAKFLLSLTCKFKDQIKRKKKLVKTYFRVLDNSKQNN